MAVRLANASEGVNRTLCVVFVCLLLVTSLSVPVVAVTAGSEPESVRNEVPTRQFHDHGGESIEIGDGLESADGTLEVVVRFEEATIPDSATETGSEERLEDHADETQAPVLEYVDSTPGVSVETEFWVTNAVLLEVDTDRVALETFGEFPAVEAIHENFELTVPEQPVVNTTDRSGPTSGVESETEIRAQQPTRGVELLNAPDVWEAYDTRGDGVRVAVLDTGIDADHPDLELATDDPSDPTYPGGWAAFDATGDRIEGSTPHDTGTHGTHVSGTVAGGAATATQIGVAPDAELLHGLVLSDTSGSFAQVIAGVEWALEEDADVISMSLGSAGRHRQLIDPVRNAVDSGTVVVAAVGNDGVETSDSPGNVYDSIGVGAVHESGAVPSFSGGEWINRSDWQSAPSSWPSSYVAPDVVAHGVGVVSTVPGGDYRAMPGTSMVTPHVSGAVALMLSVEPDATPEEISTALYKTAWKPGQTGAPTNGPATDVRYGNGIVDAKAATDSLVAAHSDIDPTTGGGADETSAMIPRATPAFSGPVIVAVSIVVLAVSVGSLLTARSIARETDNGDR
ncbi:S8 family serine peptidase [Natronorubrum halophilum]|uniref:S8 family serine peptidase n=1 Tax=Natronorubrum halophilum TaxID=1702106 RepID=UPI000EF6E67F|nr:S8 family serine peptidase [Natronorubrum halophilum]